MRGRGTWPGDNMSKPALLLLQVLPWIFNAASTCSTDEAPIFFEPYQDIAAGDQLPVDLLSARTVRYMPNVATYRSDNRFLLVLPRPHTYLTCVVDSWSLVMLLLLSGDVEENPGPSTQEMLKQILDNQATSEAKIDALRADMTEVNATCEKMNAVLYVIQDMSVRVRNLESLVRQQAEKLVEYENRSRANNLLLYGIEEDKDESDDDLKKAVIENIFKETLGVQVNTIDKIHRLGKKKTGGNRPVIMHFYDSRERERVLQNCGKLKGSLISISRDYAKDTVEVRKKVWQSSASERAAGGKVKLLNDKLKIGNRIYVWDQEKNERCLFWTEQDNTRPKGRKGKSASQNQQRPPTSGQNSGTESDSSQP
ncbi:uncharacterized protein LOC144163786 [Haemaphysalis longicornis]